MGVTLMNTIGTLLYSVRVFMCNEVLISVKGRGGKDILLIEGRKFLKNFLIKGG